MKIFLFLVTVVILCSFFFSRRSKKINKRLQKIASLKTRAIKELKISKGDIIPVPLQNEDVRLLNPEFSDEEYGVWRFIRISKSYDETALDRCFVVGEMEEDLFLLKYLPSKKAKAPNLSSDTTRYPDEMQEGDLYLASREEIFSAIRKGEAVMAEYQRRRANKENEEVTSEKQYAKITQLLESNPNHI